VLQKRQPARRDFDDVNFCQLSIATASELIHRPIMKTAPGNAGTNAAESRLARGAMVVVLLLMGGVYIQQARVLVRTSGGQTIKDDLREAMQTHLNGLCIGVMSYLQTHDDIFLDRIQSEEREASRLLRGIKEAASAEGYETSSAQLQKAHEDLQAAVADLLGVDRALEKRREIVSASNDALTSILIARIEPSIKPSQLNYSARLRAVLSAAAEAKGLSKNPGDAGSAAAGLQRFEKAVEEYASLSRTRNAGRWAEEAGTLFEQCVSQTRELQAADARKQAALDRFAQKRSVMDLVLQESRMTQRQGFRVGSIAGVVSSGLAGAGAGGLLILFAMVLAVRSFLRTGQPDGFALENLVLQDTLQCVEAAAAGDLSRFPKHYSPDDAGRLAQAAGRLISVLARSENLVYHLAALVESSGEAIISHALDGTVLSWNKGAQRIYGYSLEEMKGQSIAVLAPLGGGAEFMALLEKVRNGERITPFETLHQARNGRRVRALVRVSAIFDSKHKVIGASFCTQDLTDAPLPHPRFAEQDRIDQ